MRCPDKVSSGTGKLLESGASFFEKCLLSTTYVNFNVAEACDAEVNSTAANLAQPNIRVVSVFAIDNVFPL